MRNIYAKCTKCGKGIIFKLPRAGQEPKRIIQCFSWDGIQYRKNRTIKCKECRTKKNLIETRYLTH